MRRAIGSLTALESTVLAAFLVPGVLARGPKKTIPEKRLRNEVAGRRRPSGVFEHWKRHRATTVTTTTTITTPKRDKGFKHSKTGSNADPHKDSKKRDRLSSASSSSRKRARTDIDEPRLRHNLAHSSTAIRQVTFSWDGAWLAASSWDNTIRLYSLDDDPPEVKHTLADGTGAVYEMAFSPDCRWLAAVNHDMHLRLYRLHGDKKPKLTHDLNYTKDVRSVTFSAYNESGGGQYLAVGCSDNKIKIYNLWEDEPPVLDMELKEKQWHVWALSFLGDGRWLASGGTSHQVNVYRLFGDNSEETERVFMLRHTGTSNAAWRKATGLKPGEGAHLTTVAFSPDGRWLAAGGTDNEVRLFNFSSTARPDDKPQCTWTLRTPGNHTTSISYGDEGRWMAVSSLDAKARIYRITPKTGEPKLRYTLEDATEGLRTVAFSPDGRWLATGSLDRHVRLYSLHRLPAAVLVAEGEAGATIATSLQDYTLTVFLLLACSFMAKRWHAPRKHTCSTRQSGIVAPYIAIDR